MTAPPWKQDVGHRFWRPSVGRSRAFRRKFVLLHPFFVTILVAFTVSFSIIHLLEISMRPIVSEIAQNQIKNHFTAILENGINRALSSCEPIYSDFVSFERDQTGNISALSTNLVLINQIRGQAMEFILSELEEVDVSVVQIPLGSLFDTELLWAKGPALQARAMTVGTVEVEFDSSFTDAGVNQTLHRIWLNSQVPVTVVLPGGMLETTIRSNLCIAETVIVGQVPQAFLEMENTKR